MINPESCDNPDCLCCGPQPEPDFTLPHVHIIPQTTLEPYFALAYREPCFFTHCTRHARYKCSGCGLNMCTHHSGFNTTTRLHVGGKQCAGITYDTGGVGTKYGDKDKT